MWWYGDISIQDKCIGHDKYHGLAWYITIRPLHSKTGEVTVLSVYYSKKWLSVTTRMGNACFWNEKWISNLLGIACTQRPHNIPIASTWRSHSVFIESMTLLQRTSSCWSLFKACSRRAHGNLTARTQRSHSAHTAFSQRAHSVFTAIIAYKIVFTYF